MAPPASDEDLGLRFIEELAATLDLKETTRRLGISEERAKTILLDIGASLSASLPKRGKTRTTHVVGAPVPKRGKTCTIHVDGASRGNPGPAAAGAVISDGRGKTVARLKRALGSATNNVAEYSALVMGLKKARALGLARATVYSDSELLVKQMTGEYRVKSPNLKSLYAEARELARGFELFAISHIPREKNSVADGLANAALDERLKKGGL